jgi:carbamoyl-phosphate synthase large subunit
MNVLLTCAGRRNYVVDYFKSALDTGGYVFAANNTHDVSSMAVCDDFALMPSIYEDDYIEHVLGFCGRNDVSLIVPLFDLELPILARHKREFTDQGISVAVSDPEICNICLDKVCAQEFFEESSFNVAPLFTDVELANQALECGEISFPLFVKPRLGMGSIGVYRVNTRKQLRACFEMVQDEIQETYLSERSMPLKGKEVIIQEEFPGSHYLLDVVNDFEGGYITTFVKEPLSRWAGEADGAVTRDIPALKELGAKLSEALGHIGNLDADVFWDGENAYILDMNPRFGGGYPFSHMAGADLPAAYVAWASGKKPDPSCFEIEYGVKSVKGISLHRVKY